MLKTIVIISSDLLNGEKLNGYLSSRYKTVLFRSALLSLDFIYESLPSLIIIDCTYDDQTAALIVKKNLKEDPLFQHIPVLVIFPREKTLNPLWEEMIFEDFLWYDELERELLLRVNLALLRAERVVEINPLTRLPGNTAINRQIEGRLSRGETFALAHADLDNFKPYNDLYGFGRGDEVIKATGRIIFNVITSKGPPHSFVGHVGGDDFIFITDPSVVEETSAEIIKAFNQIIPTFYDQKDREAGFIRTADRRGISRNFPLMSLSIGVTETGDRQFIHYGQVVEAASQMKSYAKQLGGGIYRLDKRKPG